MPLRKRPEILNGPTIKAKMDCGSVYVTLNKDKGGEGELLEMAFRLGKSGHCVTVLLDCIGRLTSALLQTDLERDEVEKLIKHNMLGSSCSTKFKVGTEEYKSCLDFAAHKMLEELKKETDVKTTEVRTEKKEEPSKDGKEVGEGHQGKKE